MPRAEWWCLVFYSTFSLMWWIAELSSSLTFLSSIVSVPVPVPDPGPVSPASLVSVPAPVPVPVLSAFSRLRPHLRSYFRPQPRPRFRPCSLVPVLWTWFPPRYSPRAQALGLADEAVGYMQVSFPIICREEVACGMKVPAVKQKIITAKDVPLPLPPPNAGTRRCVCVCVFVCLC